MNKINVLIYIDVGASFETLLQEIAFELDHTKARIMPVLAEDILNHGILDRADILVMPGGADLPFCAKLDGPGNQMISAFVKEGGSYLGICAGGYYACTTLSFHAGYSDEISGSRELNFIPANAVGSIKALGPLYDRTIRSASVASIEWEGIGALGAYYHGGPMFVLEPEKECNIFGRYQFDNNPPAAVSTQVGEGVAIVCGVHLENSFRQVAAKLLHLPNGSDYCQLVTQIENSEANRRHAFRDLLTRANIPVKSL